MDEYGEVNWLVVWNIFFAIYWEQSSQLTFIFFRGGETTNQMEMLKYHRYGNIFEDPIHVKAVDDLTKTGQSRNVSIRNSTFFPLPFGIF